MAYKSPIDLIQTQISNAVDNAIYKAVVNVGVDVDKNELIKALAYDRGQYMQGYKDRDDQIVRCKDCKHRLECDYWIENGDDWFCADGKRREADD